MSDHITNMVERLLWRGELREQICIQIRCPLLDRPDVIAWLLGGAAPLCYPDAAATDPGLRAVLLTWDGGEGPYVPNGQTHDQNGRPTMPPDLWRFVEEVVAFSGRDPARTFAYVRLDPLES